MSEYDLVLAVITHPAGFILDLFGGALKVRRTESATFAFEVEWEIVDKENEIRSFHYPNEAAQFFVDMRKELRLGYDHETVTP